MQDTKAFSCPTARFVRYYVGGIINSGTVRIFATHTNPRYLEVPFRIIYRAVVAYVRAQLRVQIMTATPHAVLFGQVSLQSTSNPGSFTLTHSEVQQSVTVSYATIPQTLLIESAEGHVTVPMADILQLVAEEMKLKLRHQVDNLSDDQLLGGLSIPKTA